MTLWLVRHARPLVEAGLCYGVTDIPVDLEHSVSVANAIALVLPPNTQVISSPSTRCRVLAEALVRARGDLVVRLDERLRELDFGRWEGRRWADMAADEYSGWLDDFHHHRPGDGESVAHLLGRVRELLSEHRGPAAWVTHAGVVRAVRLLVDGTPLRSHADWPVEGLNFGEWVEVMP
jgi:alpha-ribazole phosphatase